MGSVSLTPSFDMQSGLAKASDAKFAQAASRISDAAKDKKMEQVDEASKQFEAMFISEMLSHMFDSVKVDPEFGGGQAEETYRGLMIEEYGKQIANNGGIGLANEIKAQMIAMQEAADQSEQKTK